MTQFKWTPKPSIAFQRKGVGTIMVIGKELIQFDALFNVLFRKDVDTHYIGLQEAMLLVGASVTNVIEVNHDEGAEAIDE